MPWKNDTTVQEAREHLADFLSETKCYDVCASCPVYPETGVGCCDGCDHLMRDDAGQVLGCGNPNLTCLSHTCSALNVQLMNQGRLEEFVKMVDVIPREGRRGCQRREDSELLQIKSSSKEVVAEVQLGILSAPVKGVGTTCEGCQKATPHKTQGGMNSMDYVCTCTFAGGDQ
jgi:hypothetical protein